MSTMAPSAPPPPAADDAPSPPAADDAPTATPSKRRAASDAGDGDGRGEDGQSAPPPPPPPPSPPPSAAGGAGSTPPPSGAVGGANDGDGEAEEEAATTAAATVATPSKRPRISPEGGGSSGGGAGPSRSRPALDGDGDDGNDAGKGDEGREPPASSTPAPRGEVIEIATTPPRSRSGGDSAAARVKSDPCPAIDPAAEDSDVEILSPRRFQRSGSHGSGARRASKDDGDDMDVDLEVTSSLLTNANADFPHARHLCGVRPFVFDADARGYENDNDKRCPRCYCFACDVPASECERWEEASDGGGSFGASGHCHAHDKDVRWTRLREAAAARKRAPESSAAAGEVAAPAAPRNPYRRQVDQLRRTHPAAARGGQRNQHGQMTASVHNEFLSRLADDAGNDAAAAAAEEARREKVRERKDMRVHEVLLENFRKVVRLHDDAAAEASGAEAEAAEVAATKSAATKENLPPILRRKPEGDVPSLSLHRSFYVSGVKIGWPYPEILKPQRQMAIHLIKALQNRRHVVLESPTGTGKSAAILCSVLAWQRHHARAAEGAAKRRRPREEGEGGTSESKKEAGEGTAGDDGGTEATAGSADRVKVVYCSRTHSQVAQMVASLKGTPYRPRMAILGSRERLCIHNVTKERSSTSIPTRSIKPRGRGAEAVKGINVNNECRLRVRNTEKARKHRLQNPSGDPYNDDDPPESLPSDGDPGGGGPDDGPEEGADAENQSYLRRARTCPHYRQLTASRVASLAHASFVPDGRVDCCSAGGKKSKYGAHDIEDLVSFGVDPYLQRGVALYRDDPEESFGLSLTSGGGGCLVGEVKKDTPAEASGSIKKGDKIVRVNGRDVSASSARDVVGAIKDAGSGPLLLDVSRGGAGSLSSTGDGQYSSRAACPYYTSQVLAKDADIIFAPYNYVLDPGIREALGIDLTNAVVVLDEAHNVESTLREAGSGKFGEFDLCELIVMLNNYAITEKSTGNLMDISGDAGLHPDSSESAYLCDVAHTLLLLVEKILNKLRTSRVCFQNNPGAKGAAQVLKDYERFHTSDDTEFTVTFDGPTGRGHNGKCVGCLPFFERLGLTKPDMDSLCTYVDAFDKFIRGRDGNDSNERERNRISNLVDQLIELVHKLNAAIQTPEHYYAAVLTKANGSLDFANGGDGEAESGGRRPKKKPKALPLVPPRTQQHPDRPANPCQHPFCRAKCTDAFNPVRHGEHCDGSTPKWEAILHLDLLTPGPLMQELSNECRTVILASGSLSPIPSLCAELNLFPADGPLSPVRNSNSNPTETLSKNQKRLQNQPSPLQADHVINLEKQLLAVSIGHFPDGSELKVAQKNYKDPSFIRKLGDALVHIVAGIKVGGVLVFLPSYALLGKCKRQWDPDSFGHNRRRWWTQDEESENDGPSVFDRLRALKHNVIIEPSGGQDEFEEKKTEYMDCVRTQGGCVLLAVYRGKMSEGISFNDNNARGVICIGVPLPSAFALPIKVKMDYNDEQRKMRKRTDLLPGREWYNQQAYRAIAQALGRCIRHAADYGAVFLLDVRHCDDGSPHNGVPDAHKSLPKWMRRAVKNLSKHSTQRNSMFNYSSSPNAILGGWPGLKTEMQRFFRTAKPFATEVLKKQNEKMSAASIHTVGRALKQPSTVASSSPRISNQQSASASTSLNQKMLSTPREKNRTIPASNSQGKKKSTLQELFKKQQEQEPKRSASKPARGSLKDMFEKQRAAARSAPSTHETNDADEGDNAQPPASDPSQPTNTGDRQPEPSSNEAKSMDTLAPTQSPCAKDNTLTPATEVAASTSQLTLNQPASQPEMSQSQVCTSAEQEESLCVVCEDGKKEIMLMPCLHMCLCRNCCDSFLFKTIKECPMCRAKITSSTPVYW
ncbi:hypothetical protein ACHAWF_014257 [Thalassiosira exigua]